MAKRKTVGWPAATQSNKPNDEQAAISNRATWKQSCPLKPAFREEAPVEMSTLSKIPSEDSVAWQDDGTMQSEMDQPDRRYRVGAYEV